MKTKTNKQPIGDDADNSEENAVPKEAVSFKCSIELVEQFDDFIYQSRKHLPISKRKKLNRTAFFTILLQDVLDEYEKFGNKSYLWRVLNKWVNE